MRFPGDSLINDPILDLRYETRIKAAVHDIWPWLLQMGYHRAGWYIDTWWDKAVQQYFWPRVIPPQARGTYKAPASEILPEFQSIGIGDRIPDGPPDTAYYEVIDIQLESLLLLYATTHFNYVAPQFVYRTRYAPHGAFCWAFMLEPLSNSQTNLISWWQAEVHPRSSFLIVKPIFRIIDGIHQREILKGVKKRAEKRARGRIAKATRIRVDPS